MKRGESPGMRYVRFNAWLAQWAPASWRPDLIVYEQTHNRGGAATEVAAGFATRVQEFAARHGIEYAAVHSATLKKFATGRGNAKKPEMIEAARARFGYQGQDDDEADAVALLHFAAGSWCRRERPGWALGHLRGAAAIRCPATPWG